MAKGMTISRAAGRAGVGIETIRFYERRGLIEQPQRPKAGGYRFYEEAAVERIRFIRQAQDLGFSLREIMELLTLRADPAADCGDVRAQAMTKRQEIERKIAQLRQMRAALGELIATCPGGGALRTCTIIDALGRRGGKKLGQLETTGSPSAGQQRPTVRAPGMRTAILKIEGMHCDGCARTIAAIVSAESGVKKATVSFKAREARILFDPEAVSEDRLTAAIRQAGYSVKDRA
jgi:Hg(II)-responsive transcriptional regulator